TCKGAPVHVSMINAGFHARRLNTIAMFSAGRHLISFEMFAQCEALPLIRRSDIGPVDFVGTRAQRNINEPPQGLARLNEERHVMGADFQHCPRAFHLARAVTEAAIEEAGIMDAELADVLFHRYRLP